MKSGWKRIRLWIRIQGFRIGGVGVLFLLAAVLAHADPAVSGPLKPPIQLAQSSGRENYSIRQGGLRDGSRFDVYDQSGRRTATLWDRSFGSVNRWDVTDSTGRRIGEVRGYGSPIAPRWDIYDSTGRRTGSVRDSGSSIMPRWDVYDQNNRWIGSVRPAPLEIEYFQREREKKRYIPAVPVIPPIPEPQSRRQLRDSNTPPVSAPLERPLAPPVWFTPPPMPSGNPNGQPYQYGYPFYPVPLTPPVSPTPPTPPTPPTVGNPNRMPPSGGFMAPPVSPPPRLPRYSDVYQGYGHGNAYTGYSHGNLYEGYGHGGNYYAPEPLSR